MPEPLSKLYLFLRRPLLVDLPRSKLAMVGDLLENPLEIWLAGTSEGKLLSSLEGAVVRLLRFSCTQVNSSRSTVKGTRHTSAPWNLNFLYD